VFNKIVLRYEADNLVREFLSGDVMSAYSGVLSTVLRVRHALEAVQRLWSSGSSDFGASDKSRPRPSSMSLPYEEESGGETLSASSARRAESRFSRSGGDAAENHLKCRFAFEAVQFFSAILRYLLSASIEQPFNNFRRHLLRCGSFSRAVSAYNACVETIVSRCKMVSASASSDSTSDRGDSQPALSEAVRSCLEMSEAARHGRWDKVTAQYARFQRARIELRRCAQRDMTSNAASGDTRAALEALVTDLS
jgi:hypothetical protein